MKEISRTIFVTGLQLEQSQLDIFDIVFTVSQRSID